MEFNDLTPDQQERFKACKTIEELAALAKESGFELSDEELKDVAGGALPLITTPYCPTKFTDAPFKKSDLKRKHDSCQTESDS